MLIKYINVGILNSIIGLIIIIFCFNVLNMNYNIAYLLGYIIGLINSFILNKSYTFKSKNKWTKEILAFILVFIIAYTISHIVLYFLVERVIINQNIAIICSMIVYTIIGYILNKKIFLG